MALFAFFYAQLSLVSAIPFISLASSKALEQKQSQFFFASSIDCTAEGRSVCTPHASLFEPKTTAVELDVRHKGT